MSARLCLDAPTESVERSSWAVRRADLDPFDHVNNAANWAFLEEALPAGSSRQGRAEMEFVAPVTHGSDIAMAVDRSGATSAWLLDGDRVLSAARWTPR